MDIIFAIKSLGVVGGAERVLAEVTYGLVERGHRVSVLTYDQPNRSLFYPLHPDVNRIDLGIGISNRPSTIAETLRRMFVIRKALVQMDPDIVIGFMNSMYIPLGLALIGTNLPVIASEHIGVEYYQRHPIEMLLLQLTPIITNRITIISEKLRRGFNNNLGKHMTVIPNPVGMPAKKILNKIELDKADKIILSVGRLVPQKDHKTLIEAYAILVGEFPEWNLRIVGEGDLRFELESQVKFLGLQDRIKITGVTSNISREYLNANIFVVPSLFESFGLVTAEALTYGLPVVGFGDCPGTNELIEHEKNGILVSGVQRSVALANGVRRLIKSPELRQRLRDAGPSSVAQFSREKICSKWEELLGELKKSQKIVHN